MADDHFEQPMTPYGGRITEADELHPTARVRLKMIRDLLQLWLQIDQNTCLARQQWQNSSIGIQFDLLANPEVNALAAANTRIDAVGLNAGLVVFLENGFYALMASTYFLPDIGDNSDCQSPAVIAKSIATTNITNGWGTFSPRDKERKRVAFVLSRLAELFVLFHEVCHISYGHLLHEEVHDQNNVPPSSSTERATCGPTRDYSRQWSSTPTKEPWLHLSLSSSRSSNDHACSRRCSARQPGPSSSTIGRSP
jgi:hypothetical protein